MSVFMDQNESYEFKTIDGRLYLWVIHTGHAHDGKKPHVHILDLSGLGFGMTDVSGPKGAQNLNRFLGMAKERGRVESYPYYGR